jgi:ABC-type branched-subunit amino acid transport system substrate-binding protein
MKSAKSIDADKVGAAMHAISYQGVVGTYGYDPKGNLKKTTVTVYTFKNGVLSPLASY